MSPLKLAVVTSFSSFINSAFTASRSAAGLVSARLSLLFVFDGVELAAGFILSLRLHRDNIANKAVTARIDFIGVLFLSEMAEPIVCKPKIAASQMKISVWRGRQKDSGGNSCPTNQRLSKPFQMKQTPKWLTRCFRNQE